MFPSSVMLIKNVPSWIRIKVNNAGPEVIKLFPCSTQLSTEFILLINVKMPTIVDILTFISMIDTQYCSFFQNLSNTPFQHN